MVSRSPIPIPMPMYVHTVAYPKKQVENIILIFFYRILKKKET